MHKVLAACLLVLVLAVPAAGGDRDKPSSREGLAEKDKALCLPVVAPECGCVYSCGVGWPVGEGEYKVRHSFWGKTPLNARVDEWCVDKKCTKAFFVQIVCDGICPRRPADSTCHFEGDLCVGASGDKGAGR